MTFLVIYSNKIYIASTLLVSTPQLTFAVSCLTNCMI